MRIFFLLLTALLSSALAQTPAGQSPSSEQIAQIALLEVRNFERPAGAAAAPEGLGSARAELEIALSDFAPLDCPRSLARLAAAEYDLFQIVDPSTPDLWALAMQVRSRLDDVRAACASEARERAERGEDLPVTGAPPGSPGHRPEETAAEQACRAPFDRFREAEAEFESATRSATDVLARYKSFGDASQAEHDAAQERVHAAKGALQTAFDVYRRCLDAFRFAPTSGADPVPLGERQRERLFRGSVPSELPDSYTGVPSEADSPDPDGGRRVTGEFAERQEGGVPIRTGYERILGLWHARGGLTLRFDMETDSTISATVVSAGNLWTKFDWQPGARVMRGWRFSLLETGLVRANGLSTLVQLSDGVYFGGPRNDRGWLETSGPGVSTSGQNPDDLYMISNPCCPVTLRRTP